MKIAALVAGVLGVVVGMAMGGARLTLVVGTMGGTS